MILEDAQLRIGQQQQTSFSLNVWAWVLVVVGCSIDEGKMQLGEIASAVLSFYLNHSISSLLNQQQ
jgi:hypothetical protein